MKISIIIPTFNEKESIPDLYLEICAAVSGNSDWEIIFVDDGSSDGSKGEIERIIAKDSKVKLISFYRNFGKSAALSEGFKHSKGDIIITMDADLQDDPAEIPNLIKKINEGYDLVSGWKKIRHDPWTKTFPSKIFNFVTRLLTGVKIHDFNCGLKGYDKKVIKSLNIYGGLHRFIPYLASTNGFSATEIPVNHRSREFGDSKYGGSRMFKGFFDFLSVLFISKYSKRPLHVFGFVGILLFISGLIINIITVRASNQHNKRKDLRVHVVLVCSSYYSNNL